MRIDEPLPHTPFYCEENAWQLVQHSRLRDRETRVVFVSNPQRQCVFWNQRAARTRGAPLVWDYHVLVLARGPEAAWEVWDQDSWLPCPSEVIAYVAQTFSPRVPAQYLPRFAIHDGPSFVATFSSDRSHMRDRRGRLRAPPPEWPLIERAGIATNLEQFIAGCAAPDALDLEGFVLRFARVE